MKYLLIICLFFSCMAEENIAPKFGEPLKVIAYQNVRINFSGEKYSENLSYRANDYQFKIIRLPKGEYTYTAYFKEKTLTGRFIHDEETDLIIWQ